MVPAHCHNSLYKTTHLFKLEEGNREVRIFKAPWRIPAFPIFSLRLKSPLKVVPQNFPVCGGFHGPPEPPSILLDVSLRVRCWIAMQQGAQDPLLDTCNETGPPGPVLIVSPVIHIALSPQDTSWADACQVHPEPSCV